MHLIQREKCIEKVWRENINVGVVVVVRRLSSLFDSKAQAAHFYKTRFARHNRRLVEKRAQPRFIPEPELRFN